MSTEENKTLNPKSYYYKDDTNVEIPGSFLKELIALTENLLAKEVKTESEFKYNYINEKGNVVKTFKKEDVESGKVKKIVDWEKTIYDPTLKHSLTEEGIQYAKLKNYLENLHKVNIDNGLAVTYIKSA